MRFINRYFLILVLAPLNFFAQKDNFIDSITKVYHKTTVDTQKIDLLKQVAAHLHQQGNYSEAIIYYQNIVQKHVKENPRKALDCKNEIAFEYIFMEDYEHAIDLLEKNLEESKKIAYKKGMGFAYRYFGLLNIYTGEFKKATSNYLKALEIWEQTGDSRKISMGYSDLGINFYYQENFEKAAYYWENCLKTTPDKNSDEYINNCANLGQAYIELNKYDKAEEYFKKTINYYAKEKKSSRYTNALSGLGNLEYKRKNYTKALDYYKEVISLQEGNVRRNADLAITYLNVSLMYSELNKPAEAVTYGLKGYEKAKTSGDKREILHSYNNLNTVFAKNGNFEKAYEFSQLYNGLRDSLNDIESQKQINELDKKYQTEKKEKDNQILNKQLEIQQIQGKQQKLYLIITLVILIFIGFFAAILFRQNKQKLHANQKLEAKNKIIEEQHKSIIDSINYAKLIQQAVLNEEEQVSAHLPPHFILFKPKDIVSGDFYWALEKGDYLYVTAADCTGHGVPGAFLTMLGISYLNEINSQNEIFTPAQILDQLRSKIVKELSRHGTTKDGMDISLMRFNLKTKEIMWAGAYNPLWYTDNGVLKEIKANKQPIGYAENLKPFTNHVLHLSANDTIYLFTDGLADQFGGQKGKKYKYKQLEETLMANRHKPFEEQKVILNKSFDSWKGNLEQVDDVTVIAIAAS